VRADRPLGFRAIGELWWQEEGSGCVDGSDPSLFTMSSDSSDVRRRSAFLDARVRMHRTLCRCPSFSRSPRFVRAVHQVVFAPARKEAEQ
jgi:hypothetical protein